MGSITSIMAGDKGDLMSPKFIILLVAALLLAGCAGSFTDQPIQSDEKASPGAAETEIDLKPAIPSETPVDETPDRSEQRPAQTPPPGLERVEITPLEPVTGKVPAEILDTIIVDLVERTGAEQADIQVVRAEAVVWNDGSLGCLKPGEFYIQMMINGYWVVLEVEGLEYDYRVSDKGNFKLCEGKDVSPESRSDIQNNLVEQAKEDLAARLGIPISEIDLLIIEEVTWRDGSLGCPQPGMFYTQALVNGSLIQLLHDENIFQYHSGRGGAPFLCENPPNNLEDMIAPPGFGDQ